VVCEAIQKRGCHFGIAEDRDPLCELQTGGDDDACLLIKIADQIERQCAAAFCDMLPRSTSGSVHGKTDLKRFLSFVILT
jgi:hypothetical protein